jgi:hypothetical protein
MSPSFGFFDSEGGKSLGKSISLSPMMEPNLDMPRFYTEIGSKKCFLTIIWQWFSLVILL